MCFQKKKSSDGDGDAARERESETTILFSHTEKQLLRSTGKHFHVERLDSIVFEPSLIANSAKAVGFVICTRRGEFTFLSLSSFLYVFHTSEEMLAFSFCERE